jgi:hypothetical protein
MNVPITILKDTNAQRRDEMRLPNKITIGFAHPVTYELRLGKTFGYLIKKLTSPILFSLIPRWRYAHFISFTLPKPATATKTDPNKK